MKTTKIVIIATIITVCLILSCAYALPVQAEAESRPEFYPKLTIVVEIIPVSNDLWIVECRDKDGHIWAFYDDELTWSNGDIANLLMWTINENEEEDEIIEVYWEGYTENITKWLQNNGWR